MTNAGYLFYKEYYAALPNPLEDSATIKVNNKIEGIDTIVLADAQQQTSVATVQFNNEPFELRTTYPGFLIGTGYTHEASDNNEAYKIGFHFDFATGMPVIPGHSIKGMLRSVFPNKFKKHLSSEYRSQRYAFVKETIGELTLAEIKEAEIEALETEIFEGRHKVPKHTSYPFDIFFDAVPVCIQNNFDNNTKARLFGSDYITPHKHKSKPELDPFTNPTPLKFLKVMPLVVYRFRFSLHGSRVFPALTANLKRQLFINIITTMGIGAKTNVGYGQLIEVKNEDIQQVHRNAGATESAQENIKNINALTGTFDGEVTDKVRKKIWTVKAKNHDGTITVEGNFAVNDRVSISRNSTNEAWTCTLKPI